MIIIFPRLQDFVVALLVTLFPGRSKFHITLKMRENWKGDLPKDVGSSKDDSKLFSSSLKVCHFV